MKNQMASAHKFLRFILPDSAFEALKMETKQWLLVCPCGHKRDLWDAGGVRFLAAGEPRLYLKCPTCDRRTWHTVRKNADQPDKS